MTVATHQLTLEQFLQMPETEPASEWSDGQIYPKPMPQGKSSTLQLRLADAISTAGVPRQVAYGFPELRCTFGDRSLVPDIAVFRWHRIPFDENGDVANAFMLAPDWTIEILSPDQSQTRVTDNILFCLHHQTQLGWLLDPTEKAILCFQPDQLPELIRQPDVRLPVLNGLELQLTVRQIFSWLKLKG